MFDFGFWKSLKVFSLSLYFVYSFVLFDMRLSFSYFEGCKKTRRPPPTNILPMFKRIYTKVTRVSTILPEGDSQERLPK